MGRKSSFNDSAVFAEVGRQMSGRDAFSLKAVSAATGVSIGSIYHRFGSRDGLLAETWLAATKKFQAGFLEKLRGGGDDPGLAAALSVAAFCRSHHDAAVVLACNRPRDLLGRDVPSGVAAALETVNRDLAAEVTKFTTSRGISTEQARLALLEVPLATVRLYLPARAVPPEADTYIERAYRGLMPAAAAG